MNKTMKRIFVILLLILMSVYFYMLTMVVTMQNFYHPQSGDCVIVLGHSLNNDGSMSRWLTERLTTGLSLFESGLAKNIIVTGGRGQAQAMKLWFMEQGVPENKIFTEDKSRNTYENIKFSLAIIKKNNFNSPIVVTNDFHMYRAMLIGADYLDSPSGLSAGLDLSFRKILAYIKEPFSIFKYEIYNKNL